MPLTWFILALWVVLVAKLVILGILSSIFLILASYTSFLTTTFLLHHLVYLYQQEQVLIYQHQIYLLYFSNCSNHLIHFSVYQYLILSTSDFKLAKSVIFTHDVSILVAFLKSVFVPYLDKSNSTFTFAPKEFGFG